MSPEERQLLTGLFDRIRGAASTPRDQEAEALIQDATKTQPYAPYFLAQTVLVQDQALRAANDRLQELEGKVKDLEGQAASGPRPGGFLSGLGSLFGGSGPPPRAPAPPPSGRWGQSPPPPQGGWQQPPQGYAPPGAAPGPWGGQGGSPGGGFLTGALGTAAGVAGGVLLADSIRGLFAGHNNTLGIGSGFGGTGSGLGGETVINNYYDSGGQSLSQQDAAQDAQQDAADDSQQDAQQDADQDQDDIQDASDYGSDDFGSDGDGSFDT
ncbi:MAG: histidine kinase [Beijerinckiaceae bacterium]|nr:MAG: histidine kinase [Beijerinckiaceae bacterium]